MKTFLIEYREYQGLSWVGGSQNIQTMTLRATNETIAKSNFLRIKTAPNIKIHKVSEI